MRCTASPCVRRRRIVDCSSISSARSIFRCSRCRNIGRIGYASYRASSRNGCAARWGSRRNDARLGAEMLQRLMEQAGRLLPRAKRYPTERWVRGWLESKRLASADFVIVSFGKSGRTWLRVLISRLYQQQHGLPEGSLIEFGNFHRAHGTIPRILFTHDNYLRDYTGDGAGKIAYAGKRVVLLVRHPADITVSQYFQWKHRMREHKIELNDYPSRASDPSLFEFTMGTSGLPKVND